MILGCLGVAVVSLAEGIIYKNINVLEIETI